MERIQQAAGTAQTEKGKKMSDEYIKREDAIRSIADHDEFKGERWIKEAWADYLIEDAKPVDVAPVRHGYWLPMVAENKMTKDIRGARACSECGASYFSYYDVPDIEDVVPNYCPNCGSKMDR